MTSPNQIPAFANFGERMREASRQFNEGIAELIFHMSARAALADVIANRDETRACARLQSMTDGQLDRLSHAARDLTNIIGEIIDDRNAEAIDRAETRPTVTSDLDQQIRARIDQTVMHPTSTYATLQLADALRAVLAIEYAPGDIRGRSWNRALNRMRDLIAHQLQISADPAGVTAQPLDGRAEP